MSISKKEVLDNLETVKSYINEIETKNKELESQRSELLKVLKEEIEKASEQIQGGGNGRRILIQLSEEITKKIK